MKLMNREPTEEMIEAGIKLYSSNGYTGGGIVFQAMYDAAPEIKVDMAPVAWVDKQDLERLSDFDAIYKRGGFDNAVPLYSAEQVSTLQAKLAERDKLLEQREATILEQQAKIRDFGFGIYKMANTSADNFIHDAAWAHSLYSEARKLYELRDNNTSALKSALKAERIKTLEDAAGHFADTPKGREVKEELTRMANALKEQS